jgi:hypothetical protein
MELTIKNVENLTLDGSAEGVEDAIASLVAQAASYSTPSVSPEDEEYTRSDWDGDAARSNAPNPSDEDTNLSDLRNMFLLYPTEGGATDNKSEYKLPFRSTPDGPVNLNAISAIIAAVNGARGGVEGVPEDQLRSAYNAAVRLGAEGGLYDERNDAPDFSAASPGEDLPVDTGDLPPFVRDLWGALLNRVAKSDGEVAAEFAADWTPELHPRGPDGQFVERPWDVPDALMDASTEEVISELDNADPDFREKADGLKIGDTDVLNFVEDNEDDDTDGIGDADLTEKSTKELQGLVDYFENQHDQIRKGQDPGRSNRTDTQMDELLKDTLDRLRRVEDELLSRGEKPGVSAKGADTAFRASVSGADPQGPDDMSGVVWAAGDHTLFLDGDPTPVHVPPDSIQRTYENLTDKVAAGDPPKIGLDHGDNLHKDTVPVTAELDLLKIGKATDFALSDDGNAVAMTDYELTADKAISAAEDGKFGDKDYSIVGDLRIHTNAEGTPKTVESGGKERIIVTAENVRQVDVVDNGAVDGAGPGNMPPLQSAASLAASSPTERAAAYTSALRFAASQTTDLDMKSLNELRGVDDPDAVLEGAAEVVEHKDDRIQRLQSIAEAAGIDPDDDAELDALTTQAEVVAERAEAAETLAEFYDVDLSTEDGVQTLVDEHTEDLRRDVAAKEASLPKYDTDKNAVNERVEELKGKPPAELQAMDGQRATEILDSEQARDEYGKAFASRDGADDNVGGSSSGAGNDTVEAVAQSAMTVDEKMKFKDSDHDSAAEFMAERYDEDPADFVDEDNPASAFVSATATAEGGD